MNETCKWTEDEDGLWNTECGGTFEITEGTPRENEMVFCPYCGKSIEEIAYHETTEK